MTVPVVLPDLGDSVTEATVTRWLKAEGDTVEANQPLLEVATDKVDTEIPAPTAGILRKMGMRGRPRRRGKPQLPQACGTGQSARGPAWSCPPASSQR